MENFWLLFCVQKVVYKLSHAETKQITGKLSTKQQQEVKKKILRWIPWFKFPKVTTIARLLCTQELRAIQGSPFLPVNDPCDDDGSTRATNPNEELNMSKNVGENFVQNYNIVLEDSE